MNLQEAAEKGIRRLRLPQWADPETYLLIDLVGEGMRGPWTHLYSRPGQELIGEPTPQNTVCGPSYIESDEFEEYTGPQDPSDEAPQ